MPALRHRRRLRFALGLALVSTSTAATALPLPAPALQGADTIGSESADLTLPHAPLHVPVTALRLRFTLPMLVSLADFAVVAAGNDGLFSTTGCAGALGDDVALAPAALLSFDQGRELVLRLPAPRGLAAGRYRLIACDTLASAQGVILDGDGDGLPGGHARRDLQIALTPLLDNPGFESSLASWNPTFVPLLAEAGWSAIDADGAPGSGSLRIAGLTGNGVRVDSLGCEALPLTTSAAQHYTLRLRYRVLSGHMRLFVTVARGFGPETGEPMCIGPGAWHTEVIDAGGPSTDFVTWEKQLQLSGPFPLATLEVYAIDRHDSSAPRYEVLLDDLGLSLDTRAIFGADFEARD